jgi:hypothetical protein
MRFAAVFFAFCAVAFSQSATDNYLKNRFKSLKLEAEKMSPGQTVVVTGVPERNSVCAIPLLSALPAESKIDYKLKIVKPAAPAEPAAATRSEVGIPTCK